MYRQTLTQEDYTALSEFRYLLRSFLAFSEAAAKEAGLTSRQHQALLAIKGYGRGDPITIGALAERLKVRHNTAVGLVNRLVEAGLIDREADSSDQRRVLLRLTERAERRLAQLSRAHLDDLARIRPMLEQILERYA